MKNINLPEETRAACDAGEGAPGLTALRDPLTGASNRVSFMREVSDRNEGLARDFAVAILDLDHFKLINDDFGLQAGDDLLRSIWEGLNQVLPPDSLGGRIGGDEFGFILSITDEVALKSLCNFMIEICSKERVIFGQSVTVGGSIGVALTEPWAGREVFDIIRRAELALLAAKRGGRRQVRFFKSEWDDEVKFRARVLKGLPQAISGNELSLKFQPIVSQDSLKVVGFEALIRWDSAEDGPISPGNFIPIAESTGVIHEIGDWVIPRALQACRAWPTQYVSINFSPRQFHRPGIAAHLIKAVHEAGLEPDRVQIEITETSLFEDVQEATKIIAALRDAGFRVALDDFGTGYSSLFNLTNFNISCIKIDRSFVNDLGKTASSTAIVNAMSSLARAMKLNVIAEGVEDQFQHAALRLAGCSHMQGYHFGWPMSLESATRIALQSAESEAKPLDPSGPESPSKATSRGYR